MLRGSLAFAPQHEEEKNVVRMERSAIRDICRLRARISLALHPGYKDPGAGGLSGMDCFVPLAMTVEAAPAGRLARRPG
jgi:hypothetical protein